MRLGKQFFPYLALIAGIGALGFSAIWVRWADVPPSVMGMYRMGFAVLFLTPIVTAKHNVTRCIRREYLLFPIAGGLFTAFDHFFYNSALGYTTATNATLLNNTSPLIVALIAWLVFRERLKGIFWLGLILTLFGGVAVVGYNFFINPSVGWGDMIALVSAIFYAGYFIVTQRGREHLNTLVYIWIVEGVACISMVVLSIITNQPLSGYPLRTYLVFLAAALVSQTLGYLSVGYALGHLPASLVAPTMIGQPVVTALISIPLLDERLHPVQIVGGILVLLGIYFVHKSRETMPNRDEIIQKSKEITFIRRI